MNSKELEAKRGRMNHLIWHRGSAEEILELAHEIFTATQDRVALASVHYSLAKRYLWRPWLLAMHIWEAVSLVNEAGVEKNWVFTPDQADVASTILVKAFWPLRDLKRAETIIRYALSDNPEMKPHTRALLLISLANINIKQKDIESASLRMTTASGLTHNIAGEDSPDKDRQLLRVRSAVAFFDFDHGATLEIRERSVEEVSRLLHEARRISEDQFEKLKVQCRERSLEALYLAFPQ